MGRQWAWRAILLSGSCWLIRQWLSCLLAAQQSRPETVAGCCCRPERLALAGPSPWRFFTPIISVRSRRTRREVRCVLFSRARWLKHLSRPRRRGSAFVSVSSSVHAYAGWLKKYGQIWRIFSVDVVWDTETWRKRLTFLIHSSNPGSEKTWIFAPDYNMCQKVVERFRWNFLSR